MHLIVLLMFSVIAIDSFAEKSSVILSQGGHVGSSCTGLSTISLGKWEFSYLMKLIDDCSNLYCSYTQQK